MNFKRHHYRDLREEIAGHAAKKICVSLTPPAASCKMKQCEQLWAVSSVG